MVEGGGGRLLYFIWKSSEGVLKGANTVHEFKKLFPEQSYLFLDMVGLRWAIVDLLGNMSYSLLSADVYW